ncbi:hypothetical protein RRG08_032172 [Elysia crispata]|uniref:Uncharacterized protein n=1 Tax=Elysia crispata TaxID=231223 RepID=A0AAE1ABA6_9GAST|nr:hypothetical protein RRG08_032172 [Elysia crispata]
MVSSARKVFVFIVSVTISTEAAPQIFKAMVSPCSICHLKLVEAQGILGAGTDQFASPKLSTEITEPTELACVHFSLTDFLSKECFYLKKLSTTIYT